jgi:hypothetical protein
MSSTGAVVRSSAAAVNVIGPTITANLTSLIAVTSHAMHVAQAAHFCPAAYKAQKRSGRSFSSKTAIALACCQPVPSSSRRIAATSARSDKLGGSQLTSRANNLLIPEGCGADGLIPAVPHTAEPSGRRPRKSRRCSERENLLLLEIEALPAR